jgi:RNA polymerase primary sigma factor/RNA polymerase sigma factor
LGYIYHPSFDDAKAKREILKPSPSVLAQRNQRNLPRDVDFYVAHLYEVPLLTTQEEISLFRKMNYLRFRADRLRRRLRPARATEAHLDEIERLLREAQDIRNQIVEANLRLVFSIAKRYANVGSAAFDEFVSEGHVILLRAIEKFDFSRGVKFSTYSTWCILNGFHAMLKKEGAVQRRLASDPEGIAELCADYRISLDEERSLALARRAIGDLLLNLNVREREVIAARFGLDAGRPPTLRELGQILGVSKERVRQIQERALQKLRSAAAQSGFDWVDAAVAGMGR